MLDKNDNPYLITEMLYSYKESEIPVDGWKINPIYFIKGNKEYIKKIKCQKKIIELWLGRNDICTNGDCIKLELPPQIIQDSTFVPLRALGDVLGCKTEWVASERKVIYTYNNKCKDTTTILEIWIGKNIGKKNGKIWDIGLTPQIVKDRTVVPLRAISEGLGANVSWDAETRKITILLN